jgi:hypothetical protein
MPRLLFPISHAQETSAEVKGFPGCQVKGVRTGTIAVLAATAHAPDKHASRYGRGESLAQA